MTKEVAIKKDVNSEHDLSVIEKVLMQGDLSKLTPEQRVTYYNKVCESMGLNPFTRPFDYISYQGKLTLYAKRDATEQLRQVKKISIVELEGKIVDDLYIVVAKATTPDGRIDQATGAVTIGHLKGEQKANAIMKAETKAKRRVTLSISGMGWTDESEIESIPNAKFVDVDIETGEISDKQNSSIPFSEPKKSETISNEQLASLEETLSLLQNGKSDLLKFLKTTAKIDCLEDLPVSMFNRVKNSIKLKLEQQQQLTQKELNEAVDE